MENIKDYYSNYRYSPRKNVREEEDLLDEYSDTSIVHPYGDLVPFLYFNSLIKMRREQRPEFLFETKSIKIESFSAPITEYGKSSKRNYQSVVLCCTKEEHDAACRRVMYLDSAWKNRDVYSKVFNISLINAHNEFRELGELSLGLVFEHPKNDIFPTIKQRLEDQDITFHPVIRNINNKEVNAVEVTFTHNDSPNLAHREFHRSLFRKQRTLLKRFVNIVDGKANYCILQQNGDFFTKDSDANYLSVIKNQSTLSSISFENVSPKKSNPSSDKRSPEINF